MEQILKYLLTLDDHGRKFVIEQMLSKHQGTFVKSEATCCGKQPIGATPTPNGDWNCDENTCTWYWIADIG